MAYHTGLAGYGACIKHETGATGGSLQRLPGPDQQRFFPEKQDDTIYNMHRATW